MKIDFNATYRGVSAQLQLSSHSKSIDEGGGEFGKLLSHISPDGQKSLEIQAKSEQTENQNKAAQVTDTNLMGSLKLSSPVMREPALTPFDINLLPKEPVKAADHSVKSPTLLEARRVSVFAGLNSEERTQAVQKIVTRYGKSLGVDPALGMAVASVESSFNPEAVSSDGFNSKGLFQLLDRTGQELHLQSQLEQDYNPFDPEQNTMLGMSYLRKLHGIFSEPTKLPNKLESIPAANSSSLEKLAVAAYNAGEGRVASAQERAAKAGLTPGNYDAISTYLPKSTQEYVARVMQVKGQFEGGYVGADRKEL